MFVPPVAKAQTKATPGPASNMMEQRSTLAARSSCGDQELKAPQWNRSAQGATDGLAWDLSKISIFPPSRSNRPVGIQPKLIIGSAADPLEREADSVADQVMRSPAPGIAIERAQPGISRKCAACQEGRNAPKKGGGNG
jgi:hypothetical protein